MSDHADTIRPILREHRKLVAHTFDSGPCQGASLCPACRLESALYALNALVAERQQAIDERDAVEVQRDRIAEAYGLQEARLIDERDEWKAEAKRSKWPKEDAQEFFRLRHDYPLLEARCEQAIDALREIAQLAQRFHPIAGYQYDASPANIARAALLNLGETE